MKSPLQLGQKILGTIEALAFGGLGILRHEGMVLFVPDVIPGEEVLVEVTQLRARFAVGKACTLCRPSSDRCLPTCPYFGQCGGCQLQHIDPSRHPAIKLQWLKEALHGFSVDPSITPARQVWAWRRKITLHARWEGRAWLCGFIGRDNTSIIPVRWCPLFCTKEERGLLPNIISFLDLIPGPLKASVDLSVCRLPDGAVAVLLSGTLRLSKRTVQALAQRAAKVPSLRTLSLRFPGLHFDQGPTDFTFSALNATWHFSHEAFIQNHPAQGELLWADVIAAVEKGGPRQRILDLYSGIGVTAISLALSHMVTAEELSSAAASAARASARARGISVRIETSSVEDFLASNPGGEDCWIVNPPRQGLSKKVLSLMIDRGPRRIIYVSCSPPTLSRDLRPLVRAGWTLSSVHGYDLFPQTTNLETIAVLERERL